MSELEFAGLVLEDELLDHLATPEGATAVWKERLSSEVIPESEQGIREAVDFVISYMDEYREPPAVQVLMDETGYDEFNTPVAPIDYVLGRLRDRYQRQQLKKVVSKIGRLSGEPEEALRYGLGEFSRIKNQTAVIGGAISSDDFATTLDDYRKRQEFQENGITLGYEEIDAHLGGLRLGELTIILARPKRFKSWQLVKSAVGANLAGHDVCIGSFELSEAEMRNRVHCQIAGVSWYRFQHGLLTEPELDYLEQVARERMEWPHKIHIVRPKVGDRTVAHITSYAEDKGAEVLYIDQLSWFDGAKDEGNWRIIGKIMEQLKDATQQYPIYMAAQYNREATAVEGIADLAKIGLSDYIGQTADTLLGIYASRDMLNNKIIHLGVVESRSFEPVSWEVKIELSENSNFKFLNDLGED